MSKVLAASGFASLRYDKRGVGTSEGNYWETGFYDNAGDALSAFLFLKEQNEINAEQVFLLGHSEGAYISIHVAANDADVAGIILLAGGAKLGEETLKWQAIKVVEGMKGLNKRLISLLHLDITKSQ